MNDALKSLVSLLELETLEETLFRGQSQDLGFPQLYGGQVLGQALAAAARTVPDERRPHSQHGYFLRPGDPPQHDWKMVPQFDCRMASR